MNQVALEITEKWIQEVLIPCTERGESFDVSKEMISITLEAICKTAFEYDITKQIRPGNVLEHNDGLWAAVKVDHVKPGKGGAFAQVELRNLRNGSKLNERFRSADKVERVRLEQKDMQFLYENDGMLVFMDTETYDQVELPVDILGDRRPFLQDGMTIVVEFYESEALNATLPQKVTCQVVETEPVVKGQTAANSFKPAILDNGVKVSVPPFVGQDEMIVVNTETMEYAERA